MEYKGNWNKYLELLSQKYRNVEEVTEEIINLQSILNLPKGTEVFVSDIHAEYEPFLHILNNGAGIIRSKIERIFKDSVPESERSTLATLIYYPEEKLTLIKKQEIDLDDWYSITLHRLIDVAKEITSKYTRSKVRKALPKGFDYIIDELLHLQGDTKNKERYYSQIIKTIIDLKRADEFIVAISNLIKRMAIDHLHVIGDIYDRGMSAPIVMNALMQFHSLDIQWGNHDILWMGAACGNKACICNVVRICARYDNISTLEEGYGISVRPLSTFALNTYKENDISDAFIPKEFEYNKYSGTDKTSIAKIQKAISIIQFKVEGQLIKEHPEYNMDDRLLLDKIDYKNGTITIDGISYKLNDTNFPTIDPNDPYKLTPEEEEVMTRLYESFINSEKLNTHISFLYAKGSAYTVFNSNLLFHGCIPILEDGSFKKVSIMGKILSGKEYFKFIEQAAHKAYFENDNSKSTQDYKDLMWFFWCSPDSPFFGKGKMTTFERYFINDTSAHEEKKIPYYKLVENEDICNKILKEFDIDSEDAHIINGHIPVKAVKGEVPVKANGKLLVIDGGFSKTYREQTGEAGYTLSYNSYGLLLAANKPFESKQHIIETECDLQSEIVLKKENVERKRVADTDIGTKLKGEIEDLKMLLTAYREGMIKEKI